MLAEPRERWIWGDAELLIKGPPVVFRVHQAAGAVASSPECLDQAEGRPAFEGVELRDSKPPPCGGTGLPRVHRTLGQALHSAVPNLGELLTPALYPSLELR
jgi:hypothetical protein